MMRNSSMLAIAFAAALGACGKPPAGGSDNSLTATNDAALGQGTPAGTADSATGTAPVGDSSVPRADRPMTGDEESDYSEAVPGDPGSPQAAVAVVKRYYDAIDDGDFRAAYALWGNDGKASDQSFEQFRSGFAQTNDSDVTVGTPKRPEGAAGSVYIEIPVTVEAELKDGTEQHFTGRYTLKRVNDVPGSSADERHWHLDSASLHTGA